MLCENLCAAPATITIAVAATLFIEVDDEEKGEHNNMPMRCSVLICVFQWKASEQARECFIINSL